MSGKNIQKLDRESILPESESHWLNLRARDLTSTESAALFGLSPYCTEFELWYRKRDAQVVQIEANERMKWGTRLQDSIAEGIAEDEGWFIRRLEDYVRIPDFRMGSSFDYGILNANGDITGLLEVKNVDSLAFKEGWIFDGENIEAPPHIEIQVQHQLAVFPKVEKAYIGALVGGNRVVLIERYPDFKVIEQIKERILSFWHSIQIDKAPNPDFRRDADFISQLCRFSQTGFVLDAEFNPVLSKMAASHKILGDRIKELDIERNALKAEMLLMIGPAEKVLGDGFTISTATVPGAHVEFDRDPYRAFRINWKKEKK